MELRARHDLWRDTWTALSAAAAAAAGANSLREPTGNNDSEGASEDDDESDDDDASKQYSVRRRDGSAARGTEDDMRMRRARRGRDRAAEAASKRRRLLLSPAADRAALARWLPKALRHRRLSLAFAASHDGYHLPTLLHRAAASSDHSGRSNLPSVLVVEAASLEEGPWRRQRGGKKVEAAEAAAALRSSRRLGVVTLDASWGTPHWGTEGHVLAAETPSSSSCPCSSRRPRRRRWRRH